MTRPSFLLPLLLLVELFPTGGAASSLANRWDIQGPEFEHAGLTFALDFTVQDELTTEQMEYSLFDGPGCAESAQSLAKDNKYIRSSMIVESTSIGTKQAKLSFAVDPDHVSDSSMYRTTGDGKNAELQFCVRFGVYTGPASIEESIEVNFLETIILLHATLESGFQIDAIESAS
mmetsp:Transcript_86670/g.129964  ORF Transcript_86670/g.129964 Transcript_86670/m.129964 type:complete len:175 (+) Transcript_86670:26-550(+)